MTLSYKVPVPVPRYFSWVPVPVPRYFWKIMYLYLYLYLTNSQVPVPVPRYHRLYLAPTLVLGQPNGSGTHLFVASHDGVKTPVDFSTQINRACMVPYISFLSFRTEVAIYYQIIQRSFCECTQLIRDNFTTANNKQSYFITVGCSRQFWRSRQIWRSSPN